MKKLHFSITISAPKEKVWKTMLDDATYREWTQPFSSGSYYTGDWSVGSKILFLAPGEGGKLSGMVSRIKENLPYEFVSIEHLDVVENGIEDTTSEKVKAWTGALENYTLTETNGATELIVDTDTDAENEKMFLDMWPIALLKLKELAEK